MSARPRTTADDQRLALPKSTTWRWDAEVEVGIVLPSPSETRLHRAPTEHWEAFHGVFISGMHGVDVGVPLQDQRPIHHHQVVRPGPWSATGHPGRSSTLLPWSLLVRRAGPALSARHLQIHWTVLGVWSMRSHGDACSMLAAGRAGLAPRPYPRRTGCRSAVRRWRPSGNEIAGAPTRSALR